MVIMIPHLGPFAVLGGILMIPTPYPLDNMGVTPFYLDVASIWKEVRVS